MAFLRLVSVLIVSVYGKPSPLFQCTSQDKQAHVGVETFAECAGLASYDCCARCDMHYMGECIGATWNTTGCCTYFSVITGFVSNLDAISLTYDSGNSGTPAPATPSSSPTPSPTQAPTTARLTPIPTAQAPSTPAPPTPAPPTPAPQTPARPTPTPSGPTPAPHTPAPPTPPLPTPAPPTPVLPTPAPRTPAPSMPASPTPAPPSPAPPTPAPPTPTPPSPVPPASCLCIFDVDRTLTGKQNAVDACPMNAIQDGVQDGAYGRGTLTLSELTQHVASTFCSSCHLGIISAGDASGSGSAERDVLHQKLNLGEHKLPDGWSYPGAVTSPLVLGCPDGSKQNVVPDIKAWYWTNEGVDIADRDVHFFDDRSENINPFWGLPYNAHQISCAARDLNGAIGLCGAELGEIQQKTGVTLCDTASNAETSTWREVSLGVYVSDTHDIMV